jgi:hypothetical protein
MTTDNNEQAAEEDMPYKPEEKGCCGFMQGRGPPGRIVEFVSCCLSLLCLLGIFAVLAVANTSKDEHGQYSRWAEIRLSKEVLMFTNETGMTQAMRHLQTEYNEFCKNANFEIDLQVPRWDEDNAKRFYAGKDSTLYAMSASVHAGSILLYWVA